MIMTVVIMVSYFFNNYPRGGKYPARLSILVTSFILTLNL